MLLPPRGLAHSWQFLHDGTWESTAEDPQAQSKLGPSQAGYVLCWVLGHAFCPHSLAFFPQKVWSLSPAVFWYVSCSLPKHVSCMTNELGVGLAKIISLFLSPVTICTVVTQTLPPQDLEACSGYIHTTELSCPPKHGIGTCTLPNRSGLWPVPSPDTRWENFRRMLLGISQNGARDPNNDLTT